MPKTKMAKTRNGNRKRRYGTDGYEAGIQKSLKQVLKAILGSDWSQATYTTEMRKLCGVRTMEIAKLRSSTNIDI
jgi:hypothetical protein